MQPNWRVVGVFVHGGPHAAAPSPADLSHLKKQAKDLLLQYRSGDTAALARIREGLPSTARKGDPGFTNLRLHQAQWSLAREYGFASWADLKSFVDAYSQPSSGGTLLTWLRLAYAADIAGGENRARPLVAARLLAQSDGLLGEDPYLACAIGEEAILRRATARDPGWLRRPGGPLDLPPLLALAHSTFLQLGAFRARMHACARFLLDSGSDPNQAVGSRWPPASLQAPSTVFLLSPLHGAAGRNHDPELTQMLLDAGADPNDGESLYHALDNLECTRHLLQAGAKTAGTILYRALDLDDVDVLRLLLSFGADPNEPPPRSANGRLGLATAMGNPTATIAGADRSVARSGSRPHRKDAGWRQCPHPGATVCVAGSGGHAERRGQHRAGQRRGTVPCRLRPGGRDNGPAYQV